MTKQKNNENYFGAMRQETEKTSPAKLYGVALAGAYKYCTVV